ncbi:MAG: RDD family protein [Elusimicrobiota bacterium]
MTEQTPQTEVDLATFSERVVAFSIDYALFAAGYFLSMKLASPETPALINPHGMKWALLWMSLFLAYQAWSSFGGRVSVGKRLMGLKVVTLDGRELGAGYAALRSIGYLPSCVCGAGFLWMLLNRARQTWHDMIVGSLVVEAAPRSDASRGRVRVGASLCILLFAGLWVWEFVLAAPYYNTMTVAYAQAGLSRLGELQEMHKGQKGRYADDLLSLSSVTADPEGFMRDIAALYEADPGVQIVVVGDGYTIEARARDKGRTEIHFTGGQ